MTRPLLLHMTLGIRWRTRYAAMYPDRVSDWLVLMHRFSIDLDEILLDPRVWHSTFTADADGCGRRERIYSIAYGMISPAIPPNPIEATRNFLRPPCAAGWDAGGFAQFTAFSQDAKDNESSSR